ncbi:hypothetical protein CRM22_002202 [Opisthorchis felineus]|uniref:C2H2-type domain-containing protein n=1 Tax=Opisthorchis felineus TaxID=147828 RepID=A0A4V3SGG6_OPIFE|nr:hypothetical protein CRM22_002202 [Opisthorchis felineus]
MHHLYLIVECLLLLTCTAEGGKRFGVLDGLLQHYALVELVDTPGIDKRNPVDCVREVDKSVANICCQRGEICDAGSPPIKNARNSSSFATSNDRPSTNRENSLWCNICGHLFASTYSKRRHDFGVHNNKQSSFSHRKCSICGLNWASPSALKTHMFTHSATNEFLCECCGKTFKYANALNTHVIQKHPVDNASFQEFTCYVCQRQFANPYMLRRHATSHSTKSNVYQCAYCDQSFTSCANLGKHKFTKHPDVYECPVCKVRFPCPRELQRHSVVHTRERPFVCTLCEKKYSCSDSLRRHKRVTHKDQQAPTVCSTGHPCEHSALKE